MNHIMELREIETNILQKYLDARLLIDNGRFSNAVYLLGYCTELALKHAITRHLGWHSYNTDGKFKFLKTHDLDLMVSLTGNELKVKQLPSWAIVSRWTEAKRYEDPSKANREDASEMIEATRKIVEELCEISL